MSKKPNFRSVSRVVGGAGLGWGGESGWSGDVTEASGIEFGQGLAKAPSSVVNNFDSGFENSSQWELFSSNGDVQFTTDSRYVYEGAQALVTDPNNNNGKHLAIYNGLSSGVRFAEATYKYYCPNPTYYSFGMVVREQSPGGDALGAVVNSGSLQLIEGQLGSYEVLASTPVDFDLDYWQYIDVDLIGVRESTNGDPYAIATVAGRTYSTPTAPTSLGAGRVGVGTPNAGVTGGPSAFDLVEFVLYE